MPLQIGYLLCFAGTIFISIRTDWSFLLVINFSEVEPARISCHTVAIKNLLKNYNNNKTKQIRQMSFSFRELLDTTNTWRDLANDGNLISVYKSEVYWAAIKPRLDRSYIV